MKSNKKRLTAHLYGIMPNSYLPAEMCSIGRDGMVDDVDGCSDYCDSIDNSCAECAIQNCFDLLGEYEDTGLTPEEIREIDGLYGDLSKDVMAYRKIGTLEECREAVEKQKAKKPDVWGDGYDDEGNMIYDMYSCPNCGKDYEIDYAKHDFCPACGQAIDWSDSDD